MTNVTLLEKARHGRRAALTSLNSQERHSNNVVSLFDFAHEDSPARSRENAPKVVAFRSTRTAAVQARAEAKKIAA